MSGLKAVKTEKTTKPHWHLLIFFSLLWLVMDQVSKYMALEHLNPTQSKVVIPGFFNLVIIYNRGAAFGFLNNPSTDWQFWLFFGATIVGCALVVYLMRSMPASRLLALGLSGILGGALGNFVDRVRFRAVLDFLDFHYAGWHWPAFNVADITICSGVALVLLLMWRDRSDVEPNQKQTTKVKRRTKK
jgi:signal peptidase II